METSDSSTNTSTNDLAYEDKLDTGISPNIYFKCFFIVIYSLLFAVGLVSNLLIIYFVVFYKRTKSITNKLIINLALADMLVVLVCIPVTAASEFVYDEWELGVVLCHVTSYIQGVSVSVSVLTLTTISVDRYLIICNPIKVRSVLTGRRIRIAVISVWLVSCTIMSPLLFVFDYKEETHKLDKAAYSITIKTCYENWPSIRVKMFYEIFLVLALFVMPAILMGLTFFKISKALWFDINVEKMGGSSTVCSNMNHREESVVSMLPKNEPQMDESTLNADESPQIQLPAHETRFKHHQPEYESHCNNTAMESLAYQLRLGPTSTINSQHSSQEHHHHEHTIQNQMAIRKLIAGRKRVVKLIILLTFLFLVSWLPYHCFSVMIDVLVFKDTTSKSNELINSKLARTSRTYLYPITLALALANSTVNPLCYIAFSPGFISMFRACFRSQKLPCCHK